MQLTYRVILAMLAATGIAVGVSFGLGVAYGKGDTKTVSTGLTQQQIAAIVGGTGGTGGGTGAQASGTARAGSTGTAGGGNLNNSAIGQVTAVDGQTVTLQTALGTTKVTLSNNTIIQTLTTGKASDLKVGDLVAASGTRGTDGSVAATSLSALPSSVSALLGGGNNARQQSTPTP